jgi:hypothetical protein
MLRGLYSIIVISDHSVSKVFNVRVPFQSSPKFISRGRHGSEMMVDYVADPRFCFGRVPNFSSRIRKGGGGLSIMFRHTEGIMSELVDILVLKSV